jgi:hypothetical protein
VVIDKTSPKTAPDIAKAHVASPIFLSFDQASGWIMAHMPSTPTKEKVRNLCWLPVELRGHRFATYNERMIVIASDTTYQLTIIDLGPMLDMLHGLGAI